MESIINLSKQVSKYCVGMEGNISIKTKDGLLIKASGSKLSDLSSSDIVGFDFNGNQISNFSKKGSMELSFHLFLLGFDNVNCISHTHPTNTLKILCSDFSRIFSKNRLFPDQVVFNGKKSCLVPYAKPGEELTKSIKTYVDSFIKEEGYFPKLILLENHGIIACGKTIDECVIITEICEKSAEIFIGSKMLSIDTYKIKFLSEDELSDLENDKNEKYRQGLL
jgi:L-fuculose-phosphate aldolase